MPLSSRTAGSEGHRHLPASSQTTASEINGNVGRKLNHEQQMARLRVKFSRRPG